MVMVMEASTMVLEIPLLESVGPGWLYWLFLLSLMILLLRQNELVVT